MENLTNWCVYMHENRINGKRYIGITSQKPTNRWSNGNGYKRCPLFFKAIEKYGWDAFRHEILYTNLTQEEAEHLEVELIKKYDTQNSEKGYNLARGGETNCGFHRTEEFKRKLSDTRAGLYTGENSKLYGIPRSEETKEKIRKAQIGVPKKDAVKQHMSESAKKRWQPDNQVEREYLRELNLGGNSAKAKTVICLETGITYPSMRDVERALGIDTSCVTRCCKGERNTAGGYHWAYAEEASGK